MTREEACEPFSGPFKGVEKGVPSDLGACKARFRPKDRPGFYRETGRELTGKLTEKWEKIPKKWAKMG